MPEALGVTALQSSNNWKIDLCSKYRENKLQALTKMVVTYQRIEVQSYNFHHHTRHEQDNGLMGLFVFHCKQRQIYEEKLIAYNHFDMT